MTENDINNNETPATSAEPTAAAPAPTAAEQPTAPYQAPAPTAQPVAYAPTAAPVEPAKSAGSWGWIVLGIFIPLVGLILFLVWRKDKPLSAKASGIGAIIGVVLNIIATIAMTVALVPAMMAADNYQTTTTTTTTTTQQQGDTTTDTTTSTTTEDYNLSDDYVIVPGNTILPELGTGTFWFEPASSYWMNEDPGETDWYYGYWAYSETDPTVVEFWGVRADDADADEGELVGSISESDLLANFEAAGWDDDVNIM